MQYTTNIATAVDIYNHFLSCDPLYLEYLKTRCDIRGYCNKIFSKAMKIEAWDNQVLVGIIAFYFSDHPNNFAYITNLSVIKSYERLHIGTELLSRCIRFIKDKNYNVIKLQVSKANIKAINLYKRFLFIIVEENGDTNTNIMILNINDKRNKS